MPNHQPTHCYPLLTDYLTNKTTPTRHRYPTNPLFCKSLTKVCRRQGFFLAITIHIQTHPTVTIHVPISIYSLNINYFIKLIFHFFSMLEFLFNHYELSNGLQSLIKVFICIFIISDWKHIKNQKYIFLIINIKKLILLK